MRNPKRVLSKAQILDRVWNYDFGGQANVVELYISYLRKKIDAGREPMIHTMRGVGLCPQARELSGTTLRSSSRTSPTRSRAGHGVGSDAPRLDGLTPGAWTLRGKLVASMLVLFFVVSVLTGATTVLFLRQVLTGQVDQQLQRSITRFRRLPPTTDHSRRPGRSGTDGSHQHGWFLPLLRHCARA